MKGGGPGSRCHESLREGAQPIVYGANHDSGFTPTHVSSQNEEFFGDGVTHCKAATRNTMAMDHDVASKLPSSIGSPSLSIPTIGIVPGDACDGQVLVYHDLLGLHPGPVPKFVRKYAELFDVQREAIERWANDVRTGSFPTDDESYS